MIERDESGSIHFRVYRPQAQSVELIADFTHWQEDPIPLVAAGDGWWTLTIDLPSGDYEFQYRIDGREWLADYAANGVRLNDYNQWLSLIHIPAAESRVVVRRAKVPQSATRKPQVA